jgi:hypothetical protein
MNKVDCCKRCNNEPNPNCSQCPDNKRVRLRFSVGVYGNEYWVRIGDIK